MLFGTSGHLRTGLSLQEEVVCRVCPQTVFWGGESGTAVPEGLPLLLQTSKVPGTEVTGPFYGLVKNCKKRKKKNCKKTVKKL